MKPVIVAIDVDNQEQLTKILLKLPTPKRTMKVAKSVYRDSNRHDNCAFSFYF